MKTENKEKVYCEYCKYSRETYYRYCDKKIEKIIPLKSSWTPFESYVKKIGLDYDNYNKNNDCPYYEPSLSFRIAKFIVKFWNKNNE